MNALEQLTAQNWNRAVPMGALLELTFVCNHACTFCYNSPTGQKEMTTVEIYDALQKIADFNVLYLTLSGGEPLIRRDFFEIAGRARELGFALRIYSNGYLIDAAMAKKIRDIVNPLEIEISIHGARPETHEKLTCVPGSLQRVIDAVRNLHAVGVKVNLKCAITRDNQDEVLDMHRLAGELGAPIIFDPVITPRDDGDRDPLQLLAGNDFLKRYWSSPEYAEARREKVPVPHENAPNEPVCGTGRSAFAIDPYGNIYPCVQWRRKVANIKDIRALKDIWYSSPVLIEVRRTAVEVGQTLLKNEPSGGHCHFCLGVAEVQTGNPLTYYPQAALNAEARRQAYEAWKQQTGKTLEDTGGILSKCAM